MNENFTNTEMLIRYMDQELNEEERGRLRSDLDASSELSRELEGLRFARYSVQQLGLKQQIADIHLEMMNELNAQKPVKAKLITMRSWAIRIAASVLMLVLTGALYLYFTSSAQSLYQEHFVAFASGTTRDASSSAMAEAYQQQDYETVIRLSLQQNPPDAAGSFFSGLAYLQTNRTIEAITAFKRVTDINRQANTGDYQDDAEYYLALACIKSNQLNEALTLFKKIHTNRLHAYHPKVSDWDIRKLKLLIWKKS